MGYSSYNSELRSSRAFESDYKSVTTDDMVFRKTFAQQDKRMIHEDMSPYNVKVRECFDSADHPNVLPVILGLDVTGSMAQLPKLLVAEGLPKIMGKLIQAGVDPSVCFTAIGDHECDNYPLQIGQFESGDLELDTWLTRSYLEGGGGGNAGESYLLAWFFAAFLVDTDAFKKRNKRGYLFTFGDEANLPILPLSYIKKIFGENTGAQKDYTAKELYDLASVKFDIYHLNIRHGYRKQTVQETGWRSLLGQNAIDIDNFEAVASTIVEIVGREATRGAAMGSGLTSTGDGTEISGTNTLTPPGESIIL